MLNKTYKEKANVAQLNDLHGLVAEQLSKNLDDPKVLSQAIKFLKDNDITADVVESTSMMSLQDSIKSIAKEAKGSVDISIEEMLELE